MERSSDRTLRTTKLFGCPRTCKGKSPNRPLGATSETGISCYLIVSYGILWHGPVYYSILWYIIVGYGRGYGIL